MPPKKIYRTKKRKGYRRKRYRKYKIGRFGKTYTRIIRTVSLGTIASAALTNTYGAIQLSLDQLPSYTEFTNLFEEYKIDKIVLKFYPAQMTENDNGTAASTPIFMYAIDKSDATAPASLNEMYQYAGLKIVNVLKPFTFKFYPCWSQYAYTGGASGYGTARGFLSCDYPAVKHYGVKYVMGLSGVASSSGYNVFAVFHMAFRGIR